ncbi:ESX-1 secretion-associated protein [Nocardia sp. NBC_00416]|uniref:ESX-1 secretion-associated protein n=1 Tax=Nocardia sp. NBC_00416 TaxID=2975991 RepID=UPI002E1A2938
MNEDETGVPDAAVRVDPGLLRAFAGRLDTEAGAVTTLDVAGVFAAAAGALPGTGFGPVAQRAADLTASCLHRVTTVAATLRTSAGDYEMTETEFDRALTTVGLDPAI